MNEHRTRVVKDGDMNGNYEDYLIREMLDGTDLVCSQCERAADDCVCEEICDHFRGLEAEPYTHEEAEQRREWLREAYLDQGHLHT